MQAVIFETLKTVLRARKMTYAELGDRLGVSEPTVKRIFATRDSKLSRLIEICDVLNVSIDQVVAQAKRVEVRPVVLGDKRETQLADDPSLLHVLFLLQDGMTSSEIQQRFKLSNDAMFFFGARLERLGLAEVHEESRIKLLLDQPIQFRRDGPLHRWLLKLNTNFIQSVFDAGDTDRSGFNTISRHISEHTARHLKAQMSKLNREISELALQDQLTLPEDELISYKLCTAWSPVEYADLVVIEEP